VLALMGDLEGRRAPLDQSALAGNLEAVAKRGGHAGKAAGAATQGDRGFVGAGRDDTAVQFIHEIGNFSRGTGGDFDDLRQFVLGVARVDPFRGVSGEKVFVEGQARDFFKYGDAYFLGCTGVDCRLVDDDIAFADDFSQHGGGFLQGSQIGFFEIVDGCGDSDDVDV